VRFQTRLLFSVAIFLASFLLFVSEPIAARQLLPVFGGSAAVWMTCLVFFQTALLVGYLYAHAITRGPAATTWQSGLHVSLLGLAVVSGAGWAKGLLHPVLSPDHPVLSIFASLGLSIGVPFVMLASTSPLLQVWFFRVEQTGIPFRLFALSNFASLLALLCYPTVIEPHLSLSLQRGLWSAGVLAFACITAVIAWQARSSSAAEPAAEIAGETAPLRSRVLWFLLPMAAAMQLSAVTAHITSNIAAIPLFWVLPLAVYLLTFILAFEFPQLIAWRGILLRLLAVMLTGLGLFLANPEITFRTGVTIAFFLAEMFFACLFCHIEAYALRPRRASETTLFYLVVAAGGATGSFLIGIAAPLVFRGNYDVAITFLVTGLLALAVVWNSGWAQRLLWTTGNGLLVFLVVAIHIAYFRQTLMATRNFYGSLRVEQTVTEHGDPIRTLLNGSIQHGTQIFSADLMRVPTTYYAEDSGGGLALLHCCGSRAKRVGVVGLGAGTLAAYGNAGDKFTFYEINPAVLPIAQNLFAWLRNSKAQLNFVDGDARASLAAEPPQHVDVLVVDAFSGDAIPVHLLTVEALAIYRRHLAPGGILAFHISNGHLDLAPEITLLAASAGLEARVIASHEDKQSGEFKATWVLVPSDRAFFDQPEIAERAEPIRAVPGLRVWTDDYSSLLPLVHW
jgi:SAM-dependent methyltransferase